MINHRAQPADDSPHEGVSRPVDMSSWARTLDDKGRVQLVNPNDGTKVYKNSHDQLDADRERASSQRLSGATPSFHRDTTQIYSSSGARTRARRPEY